MDQALISVLVLVFSVVVHECAHGWTALLLGDDTARQAGRLTLNPVPHIDLLGSLVLPAVMALAGAGIFGWAKPVPVDTRRLRDPRNDHPKVAAAGPASNLLLALAFAILLGVGLAWLRTSGDGGRSADFPLFLVKLAAAGVQVNVILALFNLIPLPPLDGSWILRRFLPPHLLAPYENLRRYGFLPLIGVILLLNFTPLSGVLYLVIARYEAVAVFVRNLLS